MSSDYYVHREEPGVPNEPIGEVVSSVEDAKSNIRLHGRPGTYVIYEHLGSDIPGEYLPVERARFIISPAGQVWQRRDSVPVRRNDHWREDGWSVYLNDHPEPFSSWQLCQPEPTLKIRGKGGSASDPIEQVLEWADAEIAKIQGA